MGIEVSKTKTINASADQIWSIVGDDFANVGDWARGVDSSDANADPVNFDGAPVGGRVCQVPGFGDVNETITDYDATERTYAFEATASKIPSFVTNLANQTKVTPLGPDKSRVEVKITADAQGIRGALVKPMMTRKFGAGIDGILEDLSVYAESGQISAGKVKALAKAGH
jgi:hypothetical protein